jgi:hypothetical protein
MIPGVGGRQLLEIRTRVPEVHQLVSRDRLITLKLMEDQLHFNRETIYQIADGDLGTSSICIKFVPHSLMIETTESSHDL